MKIRKTLDHAGIEKAWKDGVSSADIAGLFGASSEYVRTLARRGQWGKRYSGPQMAVRGGNPAAGRGREAATNAVLDMWKSGVKVADISRFVGVAESTVYNIVQNGRYAGDERSVYRVKTMRPKAPTNRGITSQPSLIRRIVGWLRA